MDAVPWAMLRHYIYTRAVGGFKKPTQSVNIFAHTVIGLPRMKFSGVFCVNHELRSYTKGTRADAWSTGVLLQHGSMQRNGL